MHILFLAPQPFYQSRGTPIAERRLLEFLSSQGHAVDLLTYHEGQDIAIPNCRVIRIPALPGVRGIRPGFSLKKLACDIVMFFRTIAIVRRQRYELVHAVEEAVFIAAVIQRVFRIPFVYDMDSSLTQQLTSQRRWLRPLASVLRACERLAVRRSLGVLTVCRALVEMTQGYDRNKLVACVEDTSLLGPAPATRRDSLRHRLQFTGPMAMYVGNLEPYQGVDLMLNSFAIVRAQIPDAALVVVGGTPGQIAGYQLLAESLGLRDAVHFLGPQPLEMLGVLLRQADVLVSPRLVGTNTPMKIYSYLDSGIAVLATRLATHTQVLDDEIAMLAAPQPEPFAAALVQLFRDGELRKQLGAAARTRVQRQFSPAAAERKLGRFYSQVERRLTGAAL